MYWIFSNFFTNQPITYNQFMLIDKTLGFLRLKEFWCQTIFSYMINQKTYTKIKDKLQIIIKNSREIDKQSIETAKQMLKQKLQSIKSQDTNLYQHLVTVLRQLILSNDRDGYHLFEYYCQNAKAQPPGSHDYRRDQFNELKTYIEKQTNLINKPSAGTEQEPVEVGPCGYIPNLVEQSKIFEKAGLGLGEQQTFLLFKSLERFSITKQVKELKFWGKINCSENDYFIAQSPAEAGEQGELPPDVEPKGTGVNKTTFWVATNLLEANWRQLPTITPQQIRIARKIKYTFSGNLDKKVFTNPYFPGTQAHLLKCQLVRIMFTCQIVPRTMYNVNAEDKKQIEPVEDWKMPDFEFLTSLDNWVHLSQNLLKNGRTTWLKPQPVQGQQVDEQKVMKQLEAKDPLQQRLKPISKDSPYGWAIKKIGDCNQYRAMSKNVEYVNNGYIHIKSLSWRGLHVVYHNKQWQYVYFGDGNKYTGEWFYPRQPEMVLSEAVDRDEVDEPNFPKQVPKQQNEQPPADG